MSEPVYFRPPDYLYSLRSAPHYGWWAGRLADGRQLLFSVRVAFFDAAGDLLSVRGRDRYPLPAEWLPRRPAGAEMAAPLPHGIEAKPRWVEQLGFEEGPIRVNRFFLPDVQVGVADLPESLAEFILDPEGASPHDWERTKMPQDAEEWLRDGLFCFHCGGGECYLESDGRVSASPA